jgi:glycosyltransferase involved in cell wall biosynthesis
MRRRRVVMLNLADTARDPRVRRTAGALVDEGHDVVVVGPRHAPTARGDARFPIHGVRPPRLGLKLLVALFAERHKDAAALVRHAAPAVLDAPPMRPSRFAEQALAAVARRIAPRLGLAAKPYVMPVDDEGALAELRRVVALNGRIAEHVVELRPDVVYANDLDTLLAGVVVKQRLGVPLVYDAHELHAEQWATSARADVWHDFYARLETALLPFTDVRLAVCDSIGRYAEREYGAEPFVTIPNVPSIKLLVSEDVLLRRRERRTFLYHGLYLPHRGLEESVLAFRHVPAASLVLRGFGPLEGRLRELVRDNGLDQRVTLAPPVHVDELVASASDADVGLNPFIAVSRNMEFALPNKFFEYMMAGLAVASSDLPELHAFTRRLDVGVLFDGAGPEQMAATMNALVNDPERIDAYRRRAWRAARDEFNWESVRGRFLAALAPVLSG